MQKDQPPFGGLPAGLAVKGNRAEISEERNSEPPVDSGDRGVQLIPGIYPKSKRLNLKRKICIHIHSRA